MPAKRKKNPNQPELPIGGTNQTAGSDSPTSNGPAPVAPEQSSKTNGNGASPKKKGSKDDNGETHVLAEKVSLTPPPRPFVPGNIELALHRRVNRSFLDYASYVIRDRANPNLTDGLKPVQRRILWALHQMD